MTPRSRWTELIAHPMSDWIRPVGPDFAPLSGEGRLLWCGIGGSLLPSETLVSALGTPEQRRRFVSLASPEAEELELRPSDQIVFASKSGRTLELWTWISRLRALPGWGQWERPPIVITQADGNPLARWAKAEGFDILTIAPGVGGRFSAFTGIGTVPLQWMGRDASAYLEGGREAVRQVRIGEGPWGLQANRVLSTLSEAYGRGVDRWVLMPYARKMETVGAWWVQLLAESLGKLDRDGRRHGITPIRALGPHDQHAQLQRWLGGAMNVGVILLTVDGSAASDPFNAPSQCPFPQLGKWRGQDILRAQAEGTGEALRAAGVPTLHWHLDRLDERTLGAFLMSWQLIVGLLGMEWHLDPFDQPAVEEGKRRTLAKLGA